MIMQIRVTAVLLLAAAGTGLLLGGGCSTPDDGAVPRLESGSAAVAQPSPAESPKRLAAGADVFANQCARCHSVDGSARGAGPDLSDYGSEGWSHPRIADYVRDPQRYYRGTKMPSAGALKLSDADIDAVAAYVGGLRGLAAYLPKPKEKKEPPKPRTNSTED